MERPHRTVLALTLLSLASLLQAQAEDAGLPDDRGARRLLSYLKQDRDGWRQLSRAAGDQGFSGIGPTAAPSAPTPAVASGLFLPYVAHPTGSWPEAVAIGDVNGDGRSDVVMTTSFYFDPGNDYMLHVFLQTAGGGLAAPVKYPLGSSPASVDIADLNGDARADVAVGNGNSVGVLLQNAGGTLDPMVAYPTPNSYSVKTGDFNGDGRTDVAGIAWGTSDVDVFLQDASGTLDPPVVYQASHGGYDELEAGDVNHDGRDDLVVMSGQLYAIPNLGILLQNPGGGFGSAVYYDIPGNVLSAGAGVGDVNGDSREDVVVSHGGNQPDSFIGVFPQTAAGTLGAVQSTASYDIPEPVEVADVNLDGRGDVIVLHGGWQAMGAYLQNPNGTLAAETLDPLPYASHYNPQGLAVGDFNGDGAPDVAIADYNNGLVVLYHTPVAPGYFTVKPCRVLDTRKPVGLVGGPALAAGDGRTFRFAGRCDIPPAAFAISLNVAVTQPTTAGHLRLYPGGTSLPPTSTINYGAGQTRANNAIVGLSSNGDLAVRCTQASGTAHVIIDVNGYFTP